MSSVWHFGSTPDLDTYLSQGAVYSQMTPSVLDDMLTVLAEEHGYAFSYRFFSAFVPGDRPLPIGVNSDVKQSTFFVAAVSAASSADQRARFHGQWGFPLDQSYFDQIYPLVAGLVSQRDPAADAGRDRVVPLGQDVTLEDAYVFDWGNHPMTLSWQVTARPTGSTAALSDPASLHPSFRPDRPGQYVLSLAASDDLMSGMPDTVRIVAEAQTVYLPIVLR